MKFKYLEGIESNDFLYQKQACDSRKMGKNKIQYNTFLDSFFCALNVYKKNNLLLSINKIFQSDINCYIQ